MIAEAQSFLTKRALPGERRFDELRAGLTRNSHFAAAFDYAQSPEGNRLVRSFAEALEEEGYHRFKLSEPGLTLLSSTENESLLWNGPESCGVIWTGQLFPERGLGSDSAAVLLDRYVSIGSAALRELNGFFSGLLLDRRDGTAIVFTDRYALTRLYVCDAKGVLFVATNVKALLRALPETRELSLQSAGEWLACGCVLQNRTLFRGINLVPGAAAWRLSRGCDPKKESYFSWNEVARRDSLSKSEFYEAIRTMFPAVLGKYYSSGEDAALSLTGGLDCRLILANSPEARAEIPCYTFNGPYRDCADVRIARRIAAALHLKHFTIPIGKSFFFEFPKLARESILLSGGGMDVTGAAELYANRFAREIASIRLTGNYGSEVLRANVAFRPHPISLGLYHSELEAAARRATQTYTEERNVDDLTFVVSKQAPWHHHHRFSLERSLLEVRSPFLDNELVSLLFRAPEDALKGTELSIDLIQRGCPVLASIPNDRGVVLSGDSPLNKLRRGYHEFCARVEYAWDYGMPQWLASIEGRLAPFHPEKLFLGHQKFCHFRHWYRHELNDFVRDTLSSPSAYVRVLTTRNAVDRIIDGHASGRANCTREIHQLLSMEIIGQTFFN